MQLDQNPTIHVIADWAAELHIPFHKAGVIVLRLIPKDVKEDVIAVCLSTLYYLAVATFSQSPFKRITHRLPRLRKRP